MSEMTGSKLFAQMLKAYEVDHIFYVPAIMLGAIAEMGSLNIKRVMTHGEKSAAYMADGYARASKKPGICLAQQIGASNLAAGLRDAYMACSPMIAVSGGPPINAHYRHGYQEIDDFPQFESVTKMNVRVDHVSRLPDLLRQAFRVATTNTPGPVHLQITGPHGQIANEKTSLPLHVDPTFKQAPAFRPAAEKTHVTNALELLKNATRPILVVGGGLVMSGAQNQLIKFAEKLLIPVATSMNAKGSIPDSHSLALGVAGTYSRACANQAIYEADLVFFIGSHTGGQLTVDWEIPSQGVKVIQLDINSTELGRNYPNTVSLCGDAKKVLEQLITQSESSQERTPWLARIQDLKDQWRKQFLPLLTSSDLPIRPERICHEISNLLPENGVLVSDTGHSGMWTGAMVDLNHQNQRFFRCAGSLGWGLPGAMGVKCALPNQTVFCFLGDGAFYYHIAELETAVRQNINVIFIVNNNSAYNQEIPLWDNVFADKKSINHQPKELWAMNHINFAKIAEGFGCLGIRVEKPEEISEALKQAMTLNEPVVIDIVTDINAFAPKAWTPRK
jgi:acetolactate synthase I/II/III large subunit